jgi:hypothetical protein
MFTYNEAIGLQNVNGTVNILFNNGHNQFNNCTMIAHLTPINGEKRINPRISCADYNRDGNLDFLVGDNSGLVEFIRTMVQATFIVLVSTISVGR